jgi:peroxiredoxin family protein
MSNEIKKKLGDLEKQVKSMEPGASNKLSMVIFSGDLDKILAGLIIATGAVAMGLKVSIFWTFWGTAALRDPKKKPRGKTFLGRMFGWMLPRGVKKVKLSKMHMAGMGTAMMKSLMKKKNVASADQMIEMAGQLGVEFCICDMSMDLMGMKPEEMIDYPNLKYCGVATFLAEAKDSKVQLFI